MKLFPIGEMSKQVGLNITKQMADIKANSQSDDTSLVDSFTRKLRSRMIKARTGSELDLDPPETDEATSVITTWRMMIFYAYKLVDTHVQKRILEILRGGERTGLATERALEAIWDKVYAEILWNSQESDDPDEGLEALKCVSRTKTQQELFDVMVYFFSITNDLEEIWGTKIGDTPRTRGTQLKDRRSHKLSLLIKRMNKDEIKVLDEKQVLTFEEAYALAHEEIRIDKHGSHEFARSGPGHQDKAPEVVEPSVKSKSVRFAGTKPDRFKAASTKFPRPSSSPSASSTAQVPKTGGGDTCPVCQYVLRKTSRTEDLLETRV